MFNNVCPVESSDTNCGSAFVCLLLGITAFLFCFLGLNVTCVGCDELVITFTVCSSCCFVGMTAKVVETVLVVVVGVTLVVVLVVIAGLLVSIVIGLGVSDGAGILMCFKSFSSTISINSISKRC
jgi:hypothetical protein